MNLAAVLLAPFALLLHPFQGHRHVEDKAVAAPANASDQKADQQSGLWVLQVPDRSAPLARLLLLPIAPPDAAQIRIESRVQIRITPRAAAPLPPDIFDDEGEDEYAHRHYSKAGKCIDVAGIVGYRPDRDNALLLFMRDHRILSAELDRTCRPRDFYLGFYLSRTKDGKLCVERDTLLSRSGMNCRLSRIRQLDEGER